MKDGIKDGVRDGVNDGEEEDRCLGPPHEMLSLSLYSRDAGREMRKGTGLRGTMLNEISDEK